LKQQQANKCRFNSTYREKVLLKDGTQVTLRLVMPADKLLLAQGMDNFSPESRYHRFLGAKNVLNDADLHYLTEIDGVDHFALGALVQPNEGVGVARYVRFGEDHKVAEPAIAVLDAYQNKGLGRVLFTRLIAAARERGIQRFHGSMLSDNKPMKSLLHAVGHKICFEYKGPIVEFEMPIDKEVAQ
jgi:GNAT superfamily N-acetyltransferase